jgi:hypothetical protein
LTPIFRNICRAIITISVVVAGFVYPVSAQAVAVNCSGGGTFTISGNTVTSSSTCIGTANIPSGITSISANAFKDALNLTEVNLPATLTSINSQAFYQSGLLSVSIPDLVIDVGVNAFAGTALRSVVIGNGDTNLGYGAFQQNFYLSSVQIGTGAVHLGAAAFYNNDTHSITSFSGGAGMTYIGAGAFFGSGLTSFVVPDSVVEIADQAFAANLFLTSLTIGNGVTTIGTDIFLEDHRGPSILNSVYYCGTNSTVLNYPYPNSVVPALCPSAPVLNSLTPGDRRVSVSFTAGANNGAAITDYEYSINGGAYTSAGTTTSPFTITGLSGRTAYSVTIKARNGAGLSTASSSLTATTTDASRDAGEAAAEAARLAAAAEAEKKAKEQKELTELLSVIPSIAGLSLNLGDLANSLLTTTCVKGKSVKNIKKGAKCPKGYVKKK